MNVLNQASGKNWVMYHGDCVEVMKGLPDNSVHFSIDSPPFANLYIYSDSIADMGNSADYDEFFQHYTYAIRENFRITIPGRLCAVHCKDLPLYRNRDGAAGLVDFPGMIIRAHEEAGWVYHSRVTIWKDPVIEMQRTKNHGLLHKNFQARSEVCRQGMADYLLVFRKWEGVEGTESTEPVKHNLKAPTIANNGKGHKFIGQNPPEHFDSDRDYSIQVWQRYASPVWFDVNQTRVLNYQVAKESEDEKHICPLQLDVSDRAIDLWTNPGDVCLSKFGGIASEGDSALRMHRRYVGIELKEAYWQWAVKNLTRAEAESSVVDLFQWSQTQPAD